MPGQILIKACLNGPRTKAEHQAVPILPSEIASDVADVVEAGTGAVHFHPRDLNGEETLDAGPCGDAIAAVRVSCSSVPIGLSTAEWIERSLERRLELIRRWDVLPDFASVNFNEAGFEEACELLQRRGVAVEAGIWSLEDARRLVKSGLGERCLRILVEIREQDPSKAVELVSQIETLLDRSGVRAPRLHHGYGVATWAILRNAISTGKDIRAGMEDTVLLPDRSRARDNRQLVEAAVQLARLSGWEPLRSEGSRRAVGK